MIKSFRRIRLQGNYFPPCCYDKKRFSNILANYKASSSTVLLTHTSFSSLAGSNPMFPQREIPEQQISSSDSKINESFLSRHSGKIALAALFISASIFYSYYITGQNRNSIEDNLTNMAVVEPYEIQEMRNMNNISLDQYKSIVISLFESGQSSITYNEFITTLRNRKEFDSSQLISCGYLLDRLVLSYLLNNCNEDSQTMNYREVQIPVLFFLVCLSLLMTFNAKDRLEGLYFLMKKSQCSLAEVTELLTFLQDTNQIPPEKQVIEEKDGILWKTFRQKTPEDMITLEQKDQKAPLVIISYSYYYYDNRLKKRYEVWTSCKRFSSARRFACGENVIEIIKSK